MYFEWVEFNAGICWQEGIMVSRNTRHGRKLYHGTYSALESPDLMVMLVLKGLITEVTSACISVQQGLDRVFTQINLRAKKLFGLS